MRLPIAIVLLVSLAAPVHAQDPGDPARGRSYAERHCAQCHGIGPTARASPRPGLAPFKTIAETPGMTGTAISVWLRTPHDKMPNLFIEADDRDNVIAYILSLREPRAPQ